MSGDQTLTASPTAAALRQRLLRERLGGAQPEPGLGGGEHPPGRFTGAAGPRRSRIPRADRSGPLPLSWGQQQMWLLHQLAPDRADYLVPVAWRLRGPLDVAALRGAASALAARHEILRTRYELRDGQPVQRIDPPGTVPLPVTELPGVPDAERVHSGLDWAAATAAEPLSLAEQWPWRAALLRFADDDHVLLLVFHHIACDAWTTRLYAEELGALYAGGTAAAALPEPEVQYADFAAWERAEPARAALAYWRQELAGLAPLELP
ncbi:MAG TPA: condensation domain-containing protein, partial [Rugosimonospora sp.]|nr:condensation domain-containing protein [Rugosimonospora sp.]